MNDQKHILIVEDDTAILNILQDLLVKDGFLVSVAKTGKSGLDKAINLNPDLIVLDILLPEMDGRNVLKKIRARESLADTPVFILTNLGDAETVFDVSEIGKTSYFLKVDIRLEELLKKIKTQLHLEE